MIVPAEYCQQVSGLTLPVLCYVLLAMPFDMCLIAAAEIASRNFPTAEIPDFVGNSFSAMDDGF
jgi:hypothetical protein